MKKICMVSTTHKLMDSRIYYKEAMSLKNNGYDVICIYIGSKDLSGITKDGIRYIEVKPCYKIYNVSDKIFEYKNFIYERFSYDTYIKILKKCEELKCDIYHLHDIYLLQICGELKKMKFKPKIIYDVHESYADIVLDYNKDKRSINKYIFYLYIFFWERTKAAKCDFIINVEENINKTFQKYLGSSKLDLIYNYPLKEYLPKNFNENSNLKNKKYDLIYSGGITKLRGVMNILEAVNIGKQYKKDISVIFIGPINDTNLQNYIKNYIKENNLENNVFFKGKIPFEEVWNYYSQSKIGLVPIHNIKKYVWAIPIKMFEYMIMGLPVIGTNLQHIREVVLNEKYICGEVVDNIENPKEFWDSIYKILSDQELYNKYSINAMESIKNIYNWSIMEEKLLKIYKNILNKR
ncbi:glycosyltransferase family 4 protein [Clostridium botulinum]|uniref:glycosyltransferase family 4 protein n=1 Tax=Clostridium botulinum TaxID=1491 RepID=UPI000A17844D|nr:glycosyltransferase family 4 protein [Clostridium botulinum]OSB14034.1 glycosyl transferase [Clostridium botulinum]